MHYRVERFCVEVLGFLKNLDVLNVAAETIVRQLARSVSGISGNYRAVRRSRSRKEFVARLGVVVEEADESEHWLHILTDLIDSQPKELRALYSESKQLRAIFVASLKTAR